MRFTLMAFSLFFSGNALAGTLCHPQLLSSRSVDSTLELCRSEARLQERDHLFSYLSDRKEFCKIVNSGNEQSSGYKSCISELVQFANVSLTCLASSERQAQAVEFTTHDFGRVVEEHGAAEVPERIQNLFLRIARGAESIYPANPQLKTQWRIHGYKDASPNALAGADGSVIASSALWTEGTAFTDEEIAGILAHEVAHVMGLHNLEFGCKSLEWMESDLTIAEANEYFNMDLSPLSERGQSRNRISQKNEFIADMKATDILRAAGLDPQYMAQALRKLKSLTAPGGISSGTHPEMDARIDRVSKIK